MVASTYSRWNALCLANLLLERYQHSAPSRSLSKNLCGFVAHAMLPDDHLVIVQTGATKIPVSLHVDVLVACWPIRLRQDLLKLMLPLRCRMVRQPVVNAAVLDGSMLLYDL